MWKAHEGKVRHVAYIVDMSAERNGLVVTGASGFASQSCSKAWYGSVLPRRLAGSVTVRFSVSSGTNFRTIDSMYLDCESEIVLSAKLREILSPTKCRGSPKRRAGNRSLYLL